MMEEFYLKMAVLVPGARPFEMGDLDNAAYDVFAITSVRIMPLMSAYIKTGIATEFPRSYVGLVLDRSGTGWKGAMRRAGVIDSNWRGAWEVCLYNTGVEPLEIESVLENPNAKACAQVVFVQRFKKQPEIVRPEDLAPSNRGQKWQGSSDKP